jgi:hypothetical protein
MENIPNRSIQEITMQSHIKTIERMLERIQYGNELDNLFEAANVKELDINQKRGLWVDMALLEVISTLSSRMNELEVQQESIMGVLRSDDKKFMIKQYPKIHVLVKLNHIQSALTELINICQMNEDSAVYINEINHCLAYIRGFVYGLFRDQQQLGYWEDQFSANVDKLSALSDHTQELEIKELDDTLFRFFQTMQNIFNR